MKNPKRQITLYLSEAEYARLVTTARAHKHSLSGHVKHLIRGAGEFAEGPEDRVLSKVTAIQIAVDALVRNHPNKELYQVVTEVRAARLKGASHEA
jgi:hypothetical protein